MNQANRAFDRTGQQGGLTILMALVLVGVMGAATFSLSRNAIRELSMAGTVIQGEKAAAAADAGLDWVTIWGQGGVNNAAFTAALPSGGTGQTNLLAGIKTTLASSTGLYPPVTLSGSGVSSMSLYQGGSQSTANTDQNFDIQVWFLGSLPASRSGGGSSDNSGASGGTKVTSATGDYMWRVVSIGHATPKGGQTFQSQRELIATMPPF